MIVSWLTGGLGNQMFQYAAGLSLAHARRTVLKLDTSWYREYEEHAAHNRYALSCFNITEQFATREEIERTSGIRLTRTERWSIKVARWLRLYHYAHALDAQGNFYGEEPGGFHPRFFEQPDGTYLHGMWQSERFFEAIADLLRLHFSFRYPCAPAASRLEEQIRRGPSVAVHFRRGDYGKQVFAQKLGVLSLDYYDRALRTIKERVSQATYFIFSDDPAAVQREFSPDVPHVYVREDWPAHDSLRLMSACDHAIIANSTFSWWGAWLNPAAHKVVIAPDPWFTDGTAWQVVPQSWHRVPAPRGHAGI